MPQQSSPISAVAPPNTAENMGIHPLNFIGAVKDDWQLYSDRASDYTIGEPIGFGASSIVYQALWTPSEDPNAKPTPCALKVLDLDSLPPRSLQLLQRETTLMSLSKHPNVLRVRGSWTQGHRLYIALRLMNKGSAADVMHYGWPGGMEEDVIKCILRQALKGLNYLHINGFIHRDIKAANMLIDDDGTVLLGDLGVAADLSEDPQHHISSNRSKAHAVTASVALSPHTSIVIGGRGKDTTAIPPRPKIGKRKSFVGTPCWMAPELIQGKQYDASADIWSFGITALELAQGNPPRFRESAQKVLLRTLQEAPPTLDRDGGAFKYTKAFKEMIDNCLHKDPSKRPTAEQLLQSPFLRSAKKKSHLVNAILKDLPPLTKRQERRALPSALSPNSIDSWDFPTTHVSPTSSVFRHAALQELVANEDRELEANENHVVFVFDSELTPTSAQRFEHPLAYVEEQPESEQSLSSQASSPMTLGSPVARSYTGTSGTASTREVSTAPSSYVAAPSLGSKNASTSPPSTSHSSFAQTPDPPNAGDTILSQDIPIRKTEPTMSSLTDPPRKLSSVPSDPDIRSRADKSTWGKRKEGGLWKKLTSNLKRPSSRDGRAGAGVRPPLSHSPDKGGKLGSLFSSGSRISSISKSDSPAKS